MRLRNFLIGIGLWVALLPHFGFSISAENVLFSITGFVLIVASFYVAAIEDKHRHKRIIKGETLEQTGEKMNSILGHLKTIKKNTIGKIGFPERPSGSIKKEVVPKRERMISELEALPGEDDDSVVIIEEDDGRPRIRKAVSDVKIKTDSVDDIVS